MKIIIATKQDKLVQNFDLDFIPFSEAIYKIIFNFLRFVVI